MNSRQIKTGAFVIEGLNSFAMTLFVNYFYFFMQKRFDFGNKANLLLAAASGLVYVFAALVGGRYGQRAGYFTAIKTGLTIMLVGSAAGWLLTDNVAAEMAVMMIVISGACFLWPALEGLVSEGESYQGIQRNVGVYNIVWAATAAVAYFFGGALIEKFGFRSLFLAPFVIFAAELALALFLEREFFKLKHSSQPEPRASDHHPHAPAKTKVFMRLAWFSNPFAYIAINTLIAVMPGVAERLHLSTAMAGFCGSLWCFSRLAAFFGLWWWSGWHYRFRWLVGAFAAMAVSFAAILLIPNLAAVMAAELVFGVAVGLIYFSSLFYSMDVGDTKGEHGGIHEAIIGVGNFAGPVVGAASLHFLPQHPNSGAIAVSLLLAGGLLGLIGLRGRKV